MQVSPFMCQHGHWCFCTAPNDSGQSSVLYLTSISETIQKAPLAEAKTALGKQKIRLYVECRYLSHYRNSVKNCFLTQNFTEIGQSAAELWPKKIFNTANLHLCNNFRQNPLIFCWDNVILRFAIRRFCNTAAILTFQNLDLCHMTSIAIIVCFPLQNFTKAYNRVLSHGQKRFLKWQPIAIMNFENFLYLVIWLLSISKCAVVFIKIGWFLPRNAMQAQPMSSCGVCLSVCLSRCWVVSKQIIHIIKIFFTIG